MYDIAIEFNKISLLNHQAIIKFVGFSPRSYKNEPKPVVVTEVFPERTLDDILKMERKNIEFSGWNATKRLICIFGIASVMKYLHNHEIIHRNLSSISIFLDKSFYPKLYDFGICTHLLIINSMTLQTTSKIQGSSIYSAPEVINSKEYTKESDVYSFGMIVYEIIIRKKPLNNLNLDFISGFMEQNIKPELNDSIPCCYKNLIENCWSQDPTKRCSFNEIKTHHIIFLFISSIFGIKIGDKIMYLIKKYQPAILSRLREKLIVDIFFHCRQLFQYPLFFFFAFSRFFIENIFIGSNGHI